MRGSVGRSVTFLSAGRDKTASGYCRVYELVIRFKANGIIVDNAQYSILTLPRSRAVYKTSEHLKLTLPTSRAACKTIAASEENLPR